MSTTTRKTNAAERQIKLALYVKAHGPVTRTQIQTALADYAPAAKGDAAARKRAEASSRRRFERDKAALADAGIILDANSNGLYCILPADNKDLNALETGSTQASFLRVACTALLQDPDFSDGATLRQAMAKLSDQLEIPDALPWADQDAMDALRPSAVPEQGTRHKARSALATSKLLSFEYADASGKVTQREVEPIGFYTANGHEYLAAWDRSKQARRRFRLDRMGHVKVNESGRGKQDFDPHEFDPAQWQVLDFQIGDNAIQAVVRISPCALWQARNLCSAYGKIAKEPIGTETWQVTCADVKKLASWCIANGPGLVPIHPQEAADAYRQLVDEASLWAANNGDGDNAGTQTEQVDVGTHLAGQAAAVGGQEEQAELFIYDESQEAQIQESPLALELAGWADELAAKYLAADAKDASLGNQTFGDDSLLFAVLALLEQAGAVSIPQAAQFLDVSESKVYKALESLAFCYDAACDTRITLGDAGCAYASLDQTTGLRPSLTKAELEALAKAAETFTSGSIVRAVSAACLQEQDTCIQIDYWKEGSPAPQPRAINPQTIVVRDGHAYLQAWCYSAQAQRLFRLDRIISVCDADEIKSIGDRQTSALQGKAHRQSSSAGHANITTQIKAHVAFADGVPIPSWPRISKPKKPSADGVAYYIVPWFGSLWLPKQLASYGASITRIDPHELAQATGDYALSLKEQEGAGQ